MIDRALGTYRWARDHRWGELAAAIAYYLVLSVFPLVALAYAVLGHLVGRFPGLGAEVTRVVTESLPGLVGTGSGTIDVTAIAGAATAASLVGLAGLLYTGTSAVDATRVALRVVFDQPRYARSIVVRKLVDVAILALLAVGAGASVAVSVLANVATGDVLRWTGVADTTGAHRALVAIGLAMSVLLDTVVLGLAVVTLAGTRPPTRVLLAGCLWGAVGIELLKQSASLLLGHTLANPLYTGFAVIVGLLVWANLLAKVVVLAACWMSVAASGRRTPARHALPAGHRVPAGGGGSPDRRWPSPLRGGSVPGPSAQRSDPQGA
ncbi:MAG: YihY/virulence factor BrkB family protein, partial [Actinomycetes bacterium]